MRKKNKSAIIGKLCVILGVIVAIIFSGFLFIDKIIIPNYFNSYGIHGFSELFDVVGTLYASPAEKNIVKNAHSSSDWQTAQTKLSQSGFIVDSTGIITDGFSENSTSITLTDRELASVCNKLIKSDILNESITELEYLNLKKISILEINIEKDEYENPEIAKVSFIAKLDTSDTRTQISTQMQTPKTLLDMIIPKTLYFSFQFDVNLTDFSEISNQRLSINGKNQQQSKILGDLLIDFIFPEEENFNQEKFINSFSKIVLNSINELGELTVKTSNSTFNF